MALTNQVWLVRPHSHHDSNRVWIGTGSTREGAKTNAQRWLGGDPDQYVVTPLTMGFEMVKLDIAI